MITETYIDTHTHLDDEQFSGDIESVLSEAAGAGVATMINIGYSPKRWQSTMTLAEEHPQIRYALGLHPGNANEWSDQLLENLTELVERTSPVAIGEIGLDYYWTTENTAQQWISFERQIELAYAHRLPVVIHQRDAAADVAAVLRNGPIDLGVVLHSCDGDPELMDLAEEHGWAIGVGGLMTRRQSESLRSRLPSFPIHQVVLETDSPYLVPSGVKSKRNLPAHIPLIVERLAGLLDRSVSEIAAITTRNAERVFGLPVRAVTQ